MEILVCSMCRSDLELTVTEQDGEEIVAGTLRCTGCQVVYPIEDTIPNMLPPSLRG
jgi:uncharacterized protein YbaR (Trm112 family)